VAAVMCFARLCMLQHMLKRIWWSCGRVEMAAAALVCLGLVTSWLRVCLLAGVSMCASSSVGIKQQAAPAAFLSNGMEYIAGILVVPVCRCWC
jgi:hypothetical protein